MNTIIQTQGQRRKKEQRPSDMCEIARNLPYGLELEFQGTEEKEYYGENT